MPSLNDHYLESQQFISVERAAVEQVPLEQLSLSIIVPTRNESANVYPLLDQIRQAARHIKLEVIFVDDSTDDTSEVIRKASEDFAFEVSVIARPPERHNGLGKAVVEGMRAAQHKWICVMDGDLQHPPFVIPQLLEQAQATGTTLVAASRLTEGGSTAGLSFRRKLISYTLAFASRIIFPKRLQQVSDPLTGFFLVRRDMLEPDQLQPEGFKILLEVLIRSPQLQVSEVPFEFGNRHAGESKANSNEAWLLFRQMLRLSLMSQKHLSRFVTVGVSGLFVNTALMALFTELFGFYYLWSALVATQGSSFWNFMLTEKWVFADRKQSKGASGYRLLSFMLMNNALLALRGPLLTLFVAWLGLHYLTGNIVSLLIMTLLRFALADRLIWRVNPLSRATTVQVQAAAAVTGETL